MEGPADELQRDRAQLRYDRESVDVARGLKLYVAERASAEHRAEERSVGELPVQRVGDPDQEDRERREHGVLPGRFLHRGAEDRERCDLVPVRRHGPSGLRAERDELLLCVQRPGGCHRDP